MLVPRVYFHFEIKSFKQVSFSLKHLTDILNRVTTEPLKGTKTSGMLLQVSLSREQNLEPR